MKKAKFNWSDFVIYGTAILTAIICILPILYVFSVSFTDPNVYVPFEFRLVPKKFSLVVYAKVLGTADFPRALKNTAIVTIGATLMGIFGTFTFAYGLTKTDLPLRKLFLSMVLFALLFDVGLIPNYLNVRALGLINTYWALILTGMMTSYNVILAKSFLSSIPRELEDAAKIDGASYFVVFFRIILPLATAAIATLTLFMAVGAWNQYLKPVMYITDYKKQVLQVYLKTLLVDSSTTGSGAGDGGSGLPSETVRLANVVLAIIPIMCIYPFVQKYFVKGVMIGSVKG